MSASKIHSLLKEIEAAKIHYRLARHDGETITIEAVVPGQRWEIQVFEDGKVQAEIFSSSGSIVDENAIRRLINQFAD